MNKCENCGIYIADDVEVCPLCNTVLEDDQKEDTLSWWKGGAPYPELHKLHKRLHFIMRLILFLIIITECILVLINWNTSHHIWWSVISGMGMGYFYISMLYWVRHDSGLAAKIGRQLTLTILLVIGIDYFTGATGWSLEWAAPSIILAGDVIVLLLMMLNRKQWYTYTLLLLLMVLFL